MAVLAHPDDESFGMGGTLALYVQKGVEVHLVCATRGEAGLVEPEHLRGYASIGALREAELRCAAAHLGLAGVHFLDYRDSGMPGSPDNQHPQALAQAPLEGVARQVAHLIRQVRPQVILTFDPIGGYRHPDHIAVHRATVEAFRLAADADFQDGLPPYQPQKLYFHTISRGYLRMAVRLLRLLGKDPTRWGRNGDIDLVSIAVQDFPVHAKIDYRTVRARKEAASACHASQGGAGLSRGPLRWLNRLMGGVDTFMRAYPPASDGTLERDLFADVQEDIANAEPFAAFAGRIVPKHH
jgi:LmbE family N-acetylglucosaminyl deacetylase